ncbi:MAG TPA: bacteriohopanetetrol glucosamine biosynthesis glycosyltransferase HpnI [Burkholderiaceae bacterium]
MPALIAHAGAALALVAAAYSSLAALLLRRWRQMPAAPGLERPPVSILKPLCGAEPHLLDGLRSFARQDYPQLQIVFGVRDASDPAIEVVRQLQREFPELDATLVVDPRIHGENLKVSNLINMLPSAHHAILVISDSDVRVGPGYLDAVISALAPSDVGAVTCLYQGRAGSRISSRLAALFINDWYFPAVLMSQAVGNRSFASGVTIALRRRTVEAIGGLQPIADRLADDWAVCERVRRLGLKTVLCPVVVETEVVDESFRAHAYRELRWMRTIRTVAPLGYAFMGLSIFLPLAVLGAVVSWPSAWGLVPAGLSLVNRLVIHGEQRRRGAAGLGYDWMLIPLRDGLLLALWVAGFLGRGITWRGRRYRVHSGGALSALGAEQESMAGSHVPVAPRTGT